MSRIAVFGATSAIALAWARIRAAKGDELFLVGRRAEALAHDAQDLRVRGAKRVETFTCDLDDVGLHARLVRDVDAAAGGIDVALLAQGVLGEPARTDADAAAAEAVFHANFNAPASLMSHLAALMAPRRAGTVAVISSVAGDRGRAANVAYGAAKAGITAYASGLRQRLSRSGVRIVTIKPGFVDTPMTRDFEKGALWATAPSVAKGIDRAIERGAPEAYLPWFWWGIMLIIRHVPERIFTRMRF